jgi:uncharacterized membrane protein (DUF373 family)
MHSTERHGPESSKWIARAFTFVEDIVYVGLAILLSAIVLDLLASGFVDLWHTLRTGASTKNVVSLLDRSLMMLLIIELLYTVQISFREHALLPEPFLLVGLISAIRRVLVVTAEFGELRDKSPSAAQNVVIELAVMTLLIVALVGSLIFLRKSASKIAAVRG